MCWNILGGALAWPDLPAGTSCMVKDALKAVFSVGCFTKVLEAKPPSPVVQVLSSSVLRMLNQIINICRKQGKLVLHFLRVPEISLGAEMLRVGESRLGMALA